MPAPDENDPEQTVGPDESADSGVAADPVSTTDSGGAGDPVSTAGPDEADDPLAYARRLQAEIEAEAAALRRDRPDIAEIEREAGRQWEAIAQLGDDAEPSARLLRLAGRLAYADVDVPLGARAGVRQVKGAVRRLVHWYLRHLADQLNSWHDVVVRWMNRTDDRLRAAEEALGLAPLSIPGAGVGDDGGPDRFDLADLIGAAPDLPEAAADEIATAMDLTDGPVAVAGCAEGAVVAAFGRAGVSAYGVDRDPERILAGVRDGLDLRRDDPLAHLRGLSGDDLAGAVLTGFVEDLTVGAAGAVVAAVTGAVRVPGAVAVVAADPAARDPVQRDLRAGRGLAPATWAYLLERADWTVTRRSIASAGEAVELILARRP